MRTTLDLDEVVLSAARTKAAAEGISLGRAVSDLALLGLSPRADQRSAAPKGFPVLPPVPGHVLTDEIVARHRDED